jgi:hypothetical protein
MQRPTGDLEGVGADLIILAGEVEIAGELRRLAFVDGGRGVVVQDEPDRI